MAITSVTSNFWNFVDKSGSCWLWTGSLCSNGYGQCGGFLNGKKTMLLAHRAAWFLSRGEDPGGGLVILHSCDTRNCVNPNHLSKGTHSDNMRDCVAKGRFKPNRFYHRGAKHHAVLHPERAIRGDAHGMSRVSSADVLDIRRIYGAGGASLSQLGAHYGVTKQTIAAIVKRRTWRHI
jgi:hypothetical protein